MVTLCRCSTCVPRGRHTRRGSNYIIYRVLFPLPYFDASTEIIFQIFYRIEKIIRGYTRRRKLWVHFFAKSFYDYHLLGIVPTDCTRSWGSCQRVRNIVVFTFFFFSNWIFVRLETNMTRPKIISLATKFVYRVKSINITCPDRLFVLTYSTRVFRTIAIDLYSILCVYLKSTFLFFFVHALYI